MAAIRAHSSHPNIRVALGFASTRTSKMFRFRYMLNKELCITCTSESHSCSSVRRHSDRPNLSGLATLHTVDYGSRLRASCRIHSCTVVMGTMAGQRLRRHPRAPWESMPPSKHQPNTHGRRLTISPLGLHPNFG